MLSGVFQRGVLGQASPAADPAEQVAGLIAGLGSPDAQARLNAAEALAGIYTKFGDEPALEAAIPPLIEALQDEDPNVRGQAGQTFGNLAAKVKDTTVLTTAIPVLIGALQDEAGTAKEHAARALGQVARAVEDKSTLDPAVPVLPEYPRRLRPRAFSAFEVHREIAGKGRWGSANLRLRM